MVLPTLYKKSAGGKVQEWVISIIDNNDGTASTKVVHGQIDGKKQCKEVVYTKGKNEGKTNETNALSQARSEAKSKWNKQKDKGYVENISGEPEHIAPFVMRAYEYKDYKNTITFPAKIARKYDGMRCLAVKHGDKITLWSRGQKPILTAPHICEVLKDILNEGEVFDGELYVHDMHLQLQVSLFKKFDPENYRKLTYRVYDTVCNGDYNHRYGIIKNRIESNKDVLQNIVELAPAYDVYNHDEIIEYHNKFVAEGFEGAMLRWGECKYEQNKKSRKLLKVKEFIDDEFEIVGAKENEKMPGTCVFICKTKAGAEFDVMPKGSQSVRKQYWDDFQQGSLYGKMLTVRFFEWTVSDPPKPKHGTGIVVRDYE